MVGQQKLPEGGVKPGSRGNRARSLCGVRPTAEVRLRVSSLSSGVAYGRVCIFRELRSELEVDDHTTGILARDGMRDSHAAILARERALPAVVFGDDLFRTLSADDMILVDGDLGEVVVNPSEDTLISRRLGAAVNVVSVSDSIPEFRVLANVEGRESVRGAVCANADGIGLYRTEIEAIAQGRLLTEAAQLERYRAVVEAMDGEPVHIRLLDLGSDKAGAWLELPEEPNPAMGCRGARLLLARPGLLRDQVRAIARASRYGPIHVVYPMVVHVAQFRRLRTLVSQMAAEVEQGTLWHGAMLETPSACLQAGQILAEADFGCIGTNDLAQYLFACDRAQHDSQGDELIESPILWNLIEHVVQAAVSAGKPLSVCGEMAANPLCTRRFREIGVRAVSVSPKCIAAVRRAACEHQSPPQH